MKHIILLFDCCYYCLWYDTDSCWISDFSSSLIVSFDSHFSCLFIFYLLWLLSVWWFIVHLVRSDVVNVLGTSPIVWGFYFFSNAIRGECVNSCLQVVKFISDRLLVKVIQSWLCITSQWYVDWSSQRGVLHPVTR